MSIRLHLKALVPALLMTLSASAFAAELPVPAKGWQIVETRIDVSHNLEAAKTDCQIVAEPLLNQYRHVVCEPIFVYKHRTIHWTEIHSREELGGIVRSESRESSSSSRSWNDRETIARDTWWGSFFSSIYSSGSSTSSSSSYSSSERAIVLHVPVKFEMSKDVKELSYGWRLLVREPLVLNDAPAKVLYDSNNDLEQLTFSSRREAVNACAVSRFDLLSFEYDVECRVYQPAAGVFAYQLFGKKTHK